MITIRYTNGCDFVYRTIISFSSMGTAWWIVLTLSETISPYLNFVPHDYKWILLLIGIGAFFIVWNYTLEIFTKTILPFWLPSWFYVLIHAWIYITPNEANELDYLFNGSLPYGKWYPLSGFRKINREVRKETLFRLANKVSKENKWKIPFPDYEPIDQHYEKESTKKSAEQAREIDAIIKNAHHVLGINEFPVNFDIVKMAYRQKISQCHPDKFAGFDAEFIETAVDATKKINHAYKILGDYYQINGK